MLFKSTDKTNRPIFDAVIDRMHKALVSGGNKTGSTFSQIGDIIQRADMDSAKGTSFTQQALDFLLADVSGYANSLYEELRAKSELTDADIDSAEAIINALYPDNLLYPNDDLKDVLSVKQMSDLGSNLSNVLDSINALAEQAPASTIAIEDPTYPLGRVPSGESDSYFHGSIVEVDFARHLNHTKEDIRKCVVQYAYRSGALLEVAVETNGKTQNIRVPGTSVVRVLELVTNPVNNTDSTAPVSTNATVFAGLTSKELADRATSVGLPQQFLASKAGKAFISSKDGQLWLARRAGVVAALTLLNSRIRELNSAMAYDTAVIESSDSNLDEMKDDLAARYNEVVGAQAEEVPGARIDIDHWAQWKAKAQTGRALLSYLIQLYKLSGSKANMSEGIISRLYQHIVPNGSEKYTHNKVGAIIQRADMDEVNRTTVTQQALDFLEQDVSAYASNLYEQLTQKSGVTLHEIDAAEEIINSLYPEKMRVVKQLYDLSNKLISVGDELDTLRSSTRSAVYVDTPETPVITDPATQCLFKYCLELLHWEGVAHKMARGGKAELMQEIEMLRRAAGLDKEKAPRFQQVIDALMQKAKADPDEADFMLRGIAQRAYDGINRIDFKWEQFLPTMAYQERAFNVREMKIMRYLVAFWGDNLKAMGDLTGISQAAVAGLTAAMDYATKVGDAIEQEKSTERSATPRRNPPSGQNLTVSQKPT